MVDPVTNVNVLVTTTLLKVLGDVQYWLADQVFVVVSILVLVAFETT